MITCIPHTLNTTEAVAYIVESIYNWQTSYRHHIRSNLK